MNLMGLATRQKCPSFESKKLRDFARGQECALRMPWCNHDPTTTVLCHVRLFSQAGMGQKPHDFLAFHACSECHRREREAGYEDILRALMETQARVYSEFGALTPPTNRDTAEASEMTMAPFNTVWDEALSDCPYRPEDEPFLWVKWMRKEMYLRRCHRGMTAFRIADVLEGLAEGG